MRASSNTVELSPDFVDLASPRPELSFPCKASLFAHRKTDALYQRWLLSGFGVVSIDLRDQGSDEGAEECFAAAAGVVYELEEAEIGGQLLLRDAAMRP